MCVCARWRVCETGQVNDPLYINGFFAQRQLSLNF